MDFLDSNVIKRKKEEYFAIKIIKRIAGIQFIDFEDGDSLWIKNINEVLIRILHIDSNPNECIKMGKTNEEYSSWIRKCFNFLIDQKEWLILVPNCNNSIWANILVDHFDETLISLWERSICHEFVIANKKLRTMAAVFSEERCYEFHLSRF